MERIYQALLWLAGVGVVAGTIIVFLLVVNAGQFASPSVQNGTEPDALVTFWLPTLSSVAEYFNEGAALLGVAVAWADRRTSWFIPLAIVTALAMIYPIALEYVLTHFDILSLHPALGYLIAQWSFALFNVASLLPAALALVFALRGGSVRAVSRVSADAALEITRSSL